MCRSTITQLRVVLPSTIAGRHHQPFSQQLFSVWARWLMTNDRAEVYFEFGRTDHNWHLNDFLMEPAHCRAYVLGFRKLVPLPGKRSYFDAHLELTQFSHNVTTLLRPYSGGMSVWYNVGHGYTHHGQILGALNYMFLYDPVLTEWPYFWEYLRRGAGFLSWVPFFWGD